MTFMESGLAIFVFLAWGAAGVLSLYAKYTATIRPRLCTWESGSPLISSEASGGALQTPAPKSLGSAAARAGC